MRKKLLSISGALALFAALCAAADAQQLYVSKMAVRYPTGVAGDHYCELGDVGTDNDVSFVQTISGNPVDPDVWSARIESNHPRLSGGVNEYPGGCVKLCATITCVVASTPTTFGIDELTFELFKFGGGSNPLDPASTPPIKTIAMPDVGSCSCPDIATCPDLKTTVGTYCTNWDASYNINGIFGKTNGQFGFRAKVKTNQVSLTAGNISIEQTSAYPGANQKPLSVDVVDVHVVRSSPTVVGKITGVAAQPYNILYRLSKGANTSIKIFSPPDFTTVARTITDNVPRVGEGIPDGTLTNGDFWDGRDDNGNIMPSGEYEAFINADASDYFGPDFAGATTYVELDPLQITDVAIKPLGSSSTDLALISYMLTEAATVYVSIYPPLTSISVNTVPPNTGGVQPLRTFIEQKDRRVTAITYWDGRDDAGHPVCDGDYMYAIYAALPSAAAGAGGVVRTTKTQVGTVPVNRGSVLAFMSQSSTVIGSSPTATNLDPFYFRYTPVRDAFVSLNIKKMDGTSIVRQVVTNSLRTGNYSARDIWDGKDKDGLYVPSGSYLAELVTTDPFLCASAKTSTVTAQISVDMFRIVDVQAKPLLGGTSDLATVSFELSQPMYVDLNIYDTDAVITPTPWPPAVSPGTVKYNVQGMRPGRFKVTEYWDGRDSNGQMVPDGRYPFTLVAHSTSAPNAQVPMYATDQAYGYVDVSRGQIIFTSFDVSPTIPTMYSSSDDIKLPPYEIDYSLTRQSSVTVEVITMFLPEKVIATVLAGQIRDADIVYKDFWDGKDAFGNFVPGGGYNVRVRAQDITSEMASKATVQMTIDVYPLRLYDVAITPLTLDNPAVINYQVSEPMKVVTKIYKPGTSFDAYGSPRPDDSKSLVKRIIGVRPARTQISESWDGTDLTLAKVPDGNYVFKIYASTDTNAIDTVSGAYATGTNLADDVVTSNITITKSGTTDPCGDFAKMYFAPNPYPGLNGWFHIPLPMTGRVALKIYNIAGDLVYKKDYGERGVGDDIGVHGAAGPCEISHTDPACWPKVNSSGRKVAPGVYFVVARFEASEGTRGVCQTVKKILIP